MLMKKRNFCLMAACVACMGMQAQDPVHGVNGYYNYTPTQLKASNALKVGGNGKKVKDWHPEVGYSDDMNYAYLTMGINNANKEEEKGGFNFRSEMVLNEPAAGEGVMTITKAYPVLAFKLSVPVNDESLVNIGDGYCEPEFRWYNPTTGNPERLPLNGLDGNGRYRFLQYGGQFKDAFGRDSVQLNRGNNGYAAMRKANALHKEYQDTIWSIVRLASETNERAEFLIAMDLGKICAEAQTGGGVACLDTTDIKLSGFSLGFLGVFADTTVTEEINGEMVTRLKTKEERPTVFLKWIKTFSSMKAFEETLTAEKNWGDGEYVDPNKAVLGGALYDIEAFLYNYKFSDKLADLQEAYQVAKDVYNSPTASPEDYSAQVDALAAAKDAFLSAIAYTFESTMNSIVNYGGMALGLASVDAQIGDYTGKLLIPVSPENAVGFMFTDNGNINGQKVYSLKTAAGTVVQAKDGSLILVDASQLTGSNTANFIFANRGTVDAPGYDMKVGKYFYYIDSEDGTLKATEDVPSADEDINEIADYLFYPMEATYDPSDHDAEKYPMTSGEGSAWEFNGEVEMRLEPAYKASFEKYDWDADIKAVATQRATLPYVEDWNTNGWRMNTNVQVDKTLTDGEGNPISCLKLSVYDKFDNIHVDSIAVSEVVTDWNNEQSVSIMREHGKYTSYSNRVPQPNQVCDSLYAINLNSGINRYFAMKWTSTNSNITFNGFTFYVRKNVEEPAVGMGNLLEKRGDIYVWDLMECGIPFGDRKACAQYVSWNGLQSANDAVYVDWMRFYENLEDIPTETIVTAIRDVREEASKALVTVNGNTVNVYADGEVSVYTLDGRQVATAQANGSVAFTLAKGVYVVKAVNGGSAAVKKVMVN